jgi:p-cumate 2,3-dioxygenase beta subunit
MTRATATDAVRADVETTHEIQNFLNHEAELLDGWRLTDWLALLTDDCRYLVPSTDAVEALRPDEVIFIIADEHAQIVGRVERLESELAFAERPRSRTRRLISNVRVRPDADRGYRVDSNFAVYRSRRGVCDVFTGGYRHFLARSEDGTLRVRERWAVLDCLELRPQGKVSFIL